MRKNQVNFVVRLILVPISFSILLPIWIIIGIFSLKSLGSILKETGERLIDM